MANKGGRYVIVDGKRITQAEFEAMKSAKKLTKPTQTKEVKDHE